MKLKATKTHDNLKAAFAYESQANRCDLYFANNSDVQAMKAAMFDPFEYLV